jgi:hypothetical protein
LAGGLMMFRGHVEFTQSDWSHCATLGYKLGLNFMVK